MLIWPTYSDLSRSNFFWQFMTTEHPCIEAKKIVLQWMEHGESVCIQEDFFMLQCYYHGSTGHDPYSWCSHWVEIDQKWILLDRKWNLLDRKLAGAPVFHVPCIATQPKNYKRVLAGQGPPKIIWLWMVTLSRPNEPKPTFQKKFDVFILRSLDMIHTPDCHWK